MRRSGRRALGVALLAATLFAGSAGAQAPVTEIATDGSLGPAVTVLPSVPGGNVYPITDDLGTYSGQSLFHSLLKLNIGPGDIAEFSSSRAKPPSTVVARVTGGRSAIYGTLRSTIPDADLFLLNPAGISFYQGAELDIQGSFHASSAQVLRFRDGVDFDTTSATPPELLSILAPTAFGFLEAPAGSIRLLGAELSVPSGETLSLVGGRVDLFERASTSRIIAANATVQLASAKGAVDIPLDLEALDMSAAPELGELFIGRGSEIALHDSSNAPAGKLVIRAERFQMQGAVLEGRHKSATAPALGGIDVETTDAIVISDALGEQSVIGTSALSTGDAGDIRLASHGSLQLQGEVLVNSTARDTGAAGDIQLSAATIELGDLTGDLPGSSVISSETQSSAAGGAISLAGSDALLMGRGARVASLSSAEGAGGEIRIHDTARLEMSGGAQIRTDAVGSAAGAGSGGHIVVEADAIALRGGPLNQVDTLIASGTPLLSESELSTGHGGDIRVSARELTLADGGQIATGTEGLGQAGHLQVEAEQIRIHGLARPQESDASRRGPSALTTQALRGSVGNAGALDVMAELIEVENGGLISSASFGNGNGGVMQIGTSQAPVEQLRVLGGESAWGEITSAGANPAQSGTANSANLSVHANQIELRGGGQISTQSSGLDDAGNLQVHAERIEISGVFRNEAGGTSESGILSTVPDGSGSAQSGGGEISVVAGEYLKIDSGGAILTTTKGKRSGGRISIEAPRVELSGLDVASGKASRIASDTSGRFADGNGGEISLKLGKKLVMTDGAEITSTTNTPGHSGKISIAAARDAVISQGARISAESTGGGSGDGGEITLSLGRRLRVEDGAEITSSTSTSGRSGNISITADKEVLLARDARIRAESTGSGGGKGGRISLSRGQILRLEDGAEITSSTSTTGRSGNIAIAAYDEVVLARGAKIRAESTGSGGGDGGKIALSLGRSLRLEEGSEITSSTSTPGRSGDISVAASGEVVMTRGSRIRASSSGDDAGNAGSITLRGGRKLTLLESRVETSATTAEGGQMFISASDSIYLRNSELVTSVRQNEGGGGNIHIDPELAILHFSDILAQADQGPGGDILIDSDTALFSLRSVVDATSNNEALSGDIVIRSPNTFLTGQLASLDEEFLDVTALLASPCQARTKRSGSFVINARPPAAAAPDDFFDWRSSESPRVAPPECPQPPPDGF